MSNIPNIKYSDFLINQTIPEMKSKEYIPFWLKHIDYCKSGVNVGGVYISGWLYWHINFFKLTQDTIDEWGNDTIEILSPKFRDNEFYIDYALNEAIVVNNNKPLMIFGARRFGKSALLASRVSYKAFIFQNTHAMIIGASSADIGNITKYIDEFMRAKPNCFSDFTKIGDWNKTSSNIEIAYSKKEAAKKAKEEGRQLNPLTLKLFSNVNTSDNKLVFSNIAIRNLEHGQVATKGELLAGITPTEVIFDEIGKYSFINQWLSLKPALTTIRGTLRTSALMVGTGGDVDFSKNAEKYFLDADTNGFTVIKDEDFKKLIKSKHFVVDSKNKNTGLFVHGAMANVEGSNITKKSIPLVDYLDRNFSKEDKEALEGFNIEVTDWEKMQEYLIHKDETTKDEEEKVKFKMYYPRQPEDCFLVKGNNPFPAEQAKRTQDSLEENGLLGEYVTLSKGIDGSIFINSTDKLPIKDFPFKGGSYDAPLVILERPIYSDPSKIKHGTYIAGFDGYKINSSETTDSVGSFYIFKRTVGLTGYQNQIVAHIASRPKDEKTFYRQCLLALELYNAELLPEYDTNLHNYLSGKNALHRLADCKNVMESVVPNSKANTNCGLPSNQRTKEHYLKLVQSYCYEEVEVGHDKNGFPITVLGVERIHDPMLLEEIINYRRGGNFDRIAAFGHALVWNDHLSIKGIEGSDSEYVPDDELRNAVKKIKTIRNQTSGKYRRGRRFGR